MNWQSLLAPRSTERRIARQFDQQHLPRHTPAPETMGNVFEPLYEWTGVSGGWRQDSSRSRITAGLAAFLAIPLLVGWRLSSR